MSDRDAKIKLQQRADKSNGGKGSGLRIVGVIFMAAFILLAVSYLMQARNAAEAIEGLQQSVSAMQSIDHLRAERDTLEADNLRLSEELEALRQSLSDKDAAYRALEETSQRLAAEKSAMAQLLVIQERVSARRTTEARALFSAFEDWYAASGIVLSDMPVDAPEFSESLSAQALYDKLKATLS